MYHFALQSGILSQGSPPPPPIQAADVLAWYDLENDPSNLATSSFGSATVGSYTTGKNGSGAIINSSSSWSTTAASSVGNLAPNGFTVGVWFKPFTTLSSNKIEISVGDSSISLFSAINPSSFGYFELHNTTGVRFREGSINYGLSTSAFRFLVFTVDLATKTAKYYRNGVETRSIVWTGDLRGQSGNAKLSVFGGADSAYDGLFLLGRPVSQQGVDLLYNAGAGVVWGDI